MDLTNKQLTRRYQYVTIAHSGQNETTRSANDAGLGLVHVLKYLNCAFHICSPTNVQLYWQIGHMVPTLFLDLKIQSQSKSLSRLWDRMFYTHHLIVISDHLNQKGSGYWK